MASLDPCEFISQTVSRSVHPFCRAHGRDQPTDRHTNKYTDHGTSVTIGHNSCLVQRCGLINNKINTHKDAPIRRSRQRLQNRYVFIIKTYCKCILFPERGIAFLERSYRYVFTKNIQTIIESATCDLFNKVKASNDSLYHSLPPQRSLHDALRVIGHQFQLPNCIYKFLLKYLLL